MATWQDRFFEQMSKSDYTTCKEVATAANIAPSTLHTALKKEGNTPKKVTLDKIAQALNTTSQYLMYGNELTSIRSFSIPVLNRQQIPKWIHGEITAEQCMESTSTTFELTGGFAWKVDTPDMEPTFQRGDMVFFETGFQADDWEFYEPVYVMSVSVTQTEDKGVLLQDREVYDYRFIAFSELCISQGEHRFRMHSTNLLNSYRQKILARARYFVRSL